MNNLEFISKIEESFQCYLDQVSGSRSTAKLKPIHGSIAADLADRLGDKYCVYSQGYKNGKEKSFLGRYDSKRVDIAVEEKSTNRELASIEVKFVMQNYKQNSVNYFNSMLGETANLRCSHIKCFQIIIILNPLPYFKNGLGNQINRIEEVNLHNLNKYINLSKDDPEVYFHTPNKTLIYIVNNPKITKDMVGLKKEDYRSQLKINKDISVDEKLKDVIFYDGVILNDYEKFIEKICHQIKGM